MIDRVTSVSTFPRARIENVLSYILYLFFLRAQYVLKGVTLVLLKFRRSKASSFGVDASDFSLRVVLSVTSDICSSIP